MKRIGRILRRWLTVSLLGISILCLLLLVALSYKQPCFDTYHAAGCLPEILPLPGWSASSLLNSGDLTALDDLPGIGEVTAGRIIETRERDGAFYFPEDLMTVSGIGEKRLADVMAYLAEQPASPTDLEASP
ncbi:MAG: ComEA family DNA-binding protein [Aristaeellaceae bacterium]